MPHATAPPGAPPDAPPNGFPMGWMLLGAMAVAHAVALLLEGVGPVDDDFIVYRYARNWLETGVLAFNLYGPGSVHLGAEGFTSPLWLALCTAGEALSVRPSVWTPLWGILSVAVATFFAGAASARVLPRSHRLGTLLAPMLLALSPSVAWHAVSGLGTAPMMAAIAVGLWAATAHRVRLFGACMVVAVLFRLEAAAVALPIGVAAALSGSPGGEKGAGGHGRISCLLAWVAPVVACVALVTLVRWQLFGRPAPATYFVKRLPLAEELSYGARYLLRSALEGGLAVLALAAIVVKVEHRGRILLRGVAVASAAALVYTLSCGGDWMVYGRFLVPFAPVFVIGAAALALSLPTAGVRGMVIAVLLVAVGAGLRPEVRGQAIFEHRFFEAWWLRVGDELKERAPADSTLAVSPIGAIGWRSGLTVIDVLGLTHTAFLELPPDLSGVGVKGHHRHDGGWVLDQQPTYLLLGNAVVQPTTGSIDVNPWERDILADPRFRQQYVAETAWASEPDGSRRALPYFRRKDAAPLAPE